MNQKDSEEKTNAEHLNKIKSIWQNIIRIIQKSSAIQTKKNVTEKDENIIRKILNIEKNVNQNQLSIIETILKNDLKGLLNLMELQLSNIIQLLKDNQDYAQFAEIDWSLIEKNQQLLTIAIKPELLEEYCVHHAILDSDTLKIISNHLNGQYCTCGHKSGIRRLISKTEIFGFGLNLQHCNHTTYFPTYSYEQYYQAIRRFWRFGQTKPVTVDLILSDGQERIMQSLLVKKDKAVRMFEKLTQQTNSDFLIKSKEFNKEVIKPKFL